MPPPAPIPPAQVPVSYERRAPDPSPAPAARRAAIDLQIGARFQGRSFWFTDDLFQRLRPYHLLVAPGLAGSLEYYPGAHVTSGPASWFGIVASGEWTPGLSSTDSLRRSYPVTAFGFSAGLRARYTVAERLELGVTVAYGYQTFSFQNLQAMGTDGLPSVTYQFVRGALSGRVRITDRLAIMASGAYLFVLSTGEIGGPTYFPHATAGGVEAGLGGAFSVVSGLEVRLNIDWRRYFFGMHPEPSDPFIAGGAVDDYYSATVSLAFRR